MNELKIFQNSEFGELDVLMIDGKAWFPATESAKMLRYVNPHKAVNDHCRCLTKREVPHPQNPDKTIEKNFIPEGDLYRLITHSKLPGAERFESWVFDEVLPAIRKHGAYLTDAKIEEILTDPDTVIRLATDLKAERAQRKALETKVATLQPKATYYDLVLQTPDLISITKIAKDYGKSAQWMNAKLHELGVQFKQGNMWHLYQPLAGQGYAKSKTTSYPAHNGEIHTNMQTHWTQKGRMYIYDRLKAEGILPAMERRGMGE